MSVVFFTDRDLGLKFSEILKTSGPAVERHADHFPPECPDSEWLAEVSARGWVAITHDKRIRYKPNELAAVVDHKAALLVIVGDAPFAALAHSFVAASAKIVDFVQNHERPFIAKVYRASPAELKQDPSASGKVEKWCP